MYHKMPCPHCKRDLKISDEYAGRKARCPYCRNTLTVPLQAATAPPASAPPHRPPPAASAAPPVSQPQAAAPAAAVATAPVNETVIAQMTYESAPATASSRTGVKITGTNVSLLLTAPIAALATVIVYLAIVWPTKGTYFYQIFMERGWTQFACVFLTCWSLVILGGKVRKIAYQRNTMLFDLVPTEFGSDITIQNADMFIQHIRQLPCDSSRSFSVNRVLRALEHFRARGSRAEAVSLLGSQSDIDANSVSSSYTMLKAFIWAIPILGFLGTVQGIGEAVQVFAGSVTGAQDLSAVKASLGNVTGGLAVAFDTTLLALVMSIIVMFPMSSIQKTEDDLLVSIDDYSNENLVMRLSDESSSDAPGSPDAVRQAVNEVMSQHQNKLNAWYQKLDSVGSSLAQHIASGWEGIQRRLQDHAQLMLSSQQQENRAIFGNMESAQQNLVRQLQEQMRTWSAEVAAARQQHAEVAQQLASAAATVQSGQQVLIEQCRTFQNLVQGQQALSELQKSLAGNMEILARSAALAQACTDIQQSRQQLQVLSDRLGTQVPTLEAARPDGLFRRLLGRH